MVDAGGIDALVGLGVVASVQPAFDAVWGGTEGMYAARLGTERALTLNPFAEMAAAGLLDGAGAAQPRHAGRAVGGGPGVRQPPQPPAADLRPLGVPRAHARRVARGRHRRPRVPRPGQPASFAIWSVGDLVVQAPDDRIQTGAPTPVGTPGLPDLSPGAALPTTLRTVVRGRTVFERDGAFV